MNEMNMSKVQSVQKITTLRLLDYDYLLLIHNVESATDTGVLPGMENRAEMWLKPIKPTF